MTNFVDDFMEGQRAYERGDKATGQESEAWTRGYGAAYEMAETQTAISEMQERLRG